MSDCRQCVDVDWCAEHEDCGLFKQKPITNADRIRAMTDEELAEFITNTDFCELLCFGESICKDGRCDKKMLDWLREEVSDE